MLKPRVENIFQSAGWFGKSEVASEVGTITKRGAVCVMKSAACLLFSGVTKLSRGCENTKPGLVH